ncbi:MAG: hypothetical protein V4558_14750 [Gemmatimonadota bacterium]
MTAVMLALVALALIAVTTLRRDVAGPRRQLRVLATIVVVVMLWLLAPRPPGRDQDVNSQARVAIPADSIFWTRRVTVGDRVVVRGRVDSTRMVMLRLRGPDGKVDSVAAQGKFTLGAATHAPGHWQWRLEMGKRTIDIGVDVRPQPSLRLLIVEGRPSFETAALARRLAAQGASVTTVTRLTAADERVTQAGPHPPARTWSSDNLASLDAVMIASGGGALIDVASRARILAEVDRGLGLIHLVDSLHSRSDWFPFTTSVAGLAPISVQPLLDGTRASTLIAAAPITLSGGNPLAMAAGGVSLARQSPRGIGVVVAVRALNTRSWSLAGNDSLAGVFWARLLAAALRPARAEWRVSDETAAQVDQPIVVERVGEPTPEAELREAGASPERVRLPAAPGDTLRRRTMLWPSHPGWLSLSSGRDTLWLLIGAAPPASPVSQDSDPASSFRWLAWMALLAGITVLWRRR